MRGLTKTFPVRQGLISHWRGQPARAVQALTDVNLSGANMTNAVLNGANFEGANASGANLVGTNLKQESRYLIAPLLQARAPL